MFVVDVVDYSENFLNYLLQTFCPKGPVAQRIEALSLYGSKWALSEDSSFNSPHPASGLLGQKRGAIDNNYGRQ